jgi:hypothetical protein
MIKYFFNPERDEFTKDIFNLIVSNIADPFDAFYLPARNIKALSNANFQENLIVLGLVDNVDSYFSNSHEFDYWTQAPESDVIKSLKNLVSHHADKQFILLLEGNYYSERDFLPATNVTVVDWIAILETNSYPGLTPVTDKNFSSAQIGVCLNRQVRSHRLALVSLLYGLGLDKYCHTTLMHYHKQNDKNLGSDFLNHCSWQFDEHHQDVKEKMIEGFPRMQENIPAQDEDIYLMQDGIVLDFNNVDNYNKNLTSIYTDSFVEIVSGRLFTENSITVDEKFFNTIYGYNFPIIIGSTGTVEHLRHAGFDLFDDVIDHSYDRISNPIDRMCCAIYNNQHLIQDHEHTKSLWKKHKERFDRNLFHARNKVYTWYKNITLDQCNQKISGLLKNKFDVIQ